MCGAGENLTYRTSYEDFAAIADEKSVGVQLAATLSAKGPGTPAALSAAVRSARKEYTLRGATVCCVVKREHEHLMPAQVEAHDHCHSRSLGADRHPGRKIPATRFALWYAP